MLLREKLNNKAIRACHRYLHLLLLSLLLEVLGVLASSHSLKFRSLLINK